jgi:hypothetical protein
LSFCKNLSFLLNETSYEKANYQDKYLTLNLVFKALNDPIRRKILKLLKKRGNSLPVRLPTNLISQNQASPTIWTY